MISGPARDWLESRRDDLNRRFERARARWPRLDPAAFAAHLEAILPPLAEADPSGALLDRIYDLLLLHTGREAFSREPALRSLLHEVFPRLGPLLARSPTLAAALSNAVEGAGESAGALSAVFGSLGPLVTSGTQLLDAGAVAAWRLGEARLREPSLRVAASLPPRALLTALGLADWPDASASLVAAALAGDTWREPREALSAATLKTAASLTQAERERLAIALRTPQPAPLSMWRVVRTAGDFSGFGGSFDGPPAIRGSLGRHLFFLESAGERFILEADCFGWRCRRTSESARPAPSAGVDALNVLPDGTIAGIHERVRPGGLEGASSFAPFPRGVACALQDSHRIRIVAPRSVPL